MNARSVLLAGAAGAAMLLWTACGAGVVTGGILGRSDGEPSTPSDVLLGQASGPLSLAADDLLVQQVTLVNTELPPDPELRIRLLLQLADGSVSEDEQTILSVIATGRNPLLQYQHRTQEIQRALTARGLSLADQDYVAELRIELRRGGEFATIASRPFTLLRQPTATLETGASGFLTVPVDGSGSVDLTVENMPANIDGKFDVEAGWFSSTGFQRGRATVTETVDEGGGRFRVRCRIPSSTNLSVIGLNVVHVPETGSNYGRSNFIANLNYEPVALGVNIPRGGTEGGELIVIGGTALVPSDFAATPVGLDFDLLRIVFAKDGQEFELPSSALRIEQSSLNAIALIAPPSPDGLPGSADIELRYEPVRGNVTSVSGPFSIRLDGAYRYGATVADFEPRGVTLRDTPAAVAVGPVRSPWSGGRRSSDLVVLNADGRRRPVLDVYEGLGNGMLARAGESVLAAQPAHNQQIDPVDVALGDFDGDDRADVFVLNGARSHTLARGVDDRSVNLRFTGGVITSPLESVPAAVMPGPSLGGDARTDLLLHVLGPGQLDESELFAAPAGGGGGGFGAVAPVHAAGTNRFDVIGVEDLDGDGLLDVLSGGGDLTRVVIRYGAGEGAFADDQLLMLPQLSIENPPIIGVHGIGAPGARWLAVVVGSAGGVTTNAVVLVPPGPMARTFDPSRSLVLPIWIDRSPTHSRAADLDGDGVIELVVAAFGDVALITWDGSGFGVRRNLVDLRGWSLGSIQDLSIAETVDASGRSGAAVFVGHRFTDTGGESIDRVTSLVVGDGLRLRHPYERLAVRGLVDSVVVGRFGANAEPAVAAAYDDELVEFPIDAVGGIVEGDAYFRGGLLEDSLAVAPHPTDPARGDLRVFLADDGTLGVLEPGVASAPLFAPETLFLRPLVDRPILRHGDVDGDGLGDLVVLLRDEPRVGFRESTIYVLRGRAATSTRPFPYGPPEPTGGLRLAGDARDLAVANFGSDANGATRDEVAVAFPDGESNAGIVFFRFDDDAGLSRSIVSLTDPRVGQELDVYAIAAVAPVANGRGPADLLVASRRFATLTLFRQIPSASRVATPNGTVDPLTFQESDVESLPPGAPLAIELADLDGDAAIDAVVQVDGGGGVLDTVTLVLSDGVGRFRQTRVLPPHRLEDRTVTLSDAMSIAVGELNGDSAPDLVVARRGLTGVDISQLRVLFGTHR